MDPGFGLAHAARARVHATYGEAPEAAACIAKAKQAIAIAANDRERQHVEIMAAAITGRLQEAIAGAEAHLVQYPRDAIMMSLLLGAFGLYAFSGRADHDQARLDLCERYATSYGDDWWFQTYLGWSNTEAGNVSKGRAITERALASRRQNANAAHALSHAYFEAGDTGAARSLLADWLPGYSREGLLNGHISWHEALIAIEDDDIEGAITIYRDRIQPGVSQAPPLNIYTDAASFLWRAGLEGRSGLDEDWAAVEDYRQRKFPKPAPAFAAVHHGLTAHRMAPVDRVAILRAEMTAALSEKRLAPGPVVSQLFDGVDAFSQGDFKQARALLEPAMADLVRIGGSHAQRELFEDTLIMACLRGGDPLEARRRIDDRLHRRPSRRDQRWRAMTLSHV